MYFSVCNYIPLEQSLNLFFQNLDIADSQELCIKCYDSLKHYFEFALCCLEWEKKLQNFAGNRGQAVSLLDFLQHVNNSDEFEEPEDKIDIEEMTIIDEDNKK